jgi:two-component system NtrC family sensor kinase
MKEIAFSIRNSIESVRIPLLVQSILDEYTERILKHEDSSDGDEHDPFTIPPHEIHVMNRDGIVMASTRPDFMGRVFEDAIQHKEKGLNAVLAGKADYTIEQMEHLGVKVLDISVPIREEGRIIGVLHYVEPYIKLQTLIKKSFFRHVMFALGMIFSLSVMLNLFLTKLVTKPIQDLSSGMDKIRLRGTSEGIVVSSRDEIGLLAQSFNEMSKALKERNEEVKKYTSSLEEMVRERTKELEESHAQLVQTEKLASMGKLAGYIAHEINNPVGIIVARAECILMDSEEKNYQNDLIKDIEVIKNHSNRIATITRGMLTFSRKSPAEFSNVDINVIIDETLLLLENQFLKNNIKIRKYIDRSIPEIQGDKTQLQQVFFNIFSNAMGAMPEGGEIKINTNCGDDGMVHVLISDSGAGIPKDHLTKIFEPFFTTKHEDKGTGLGLSVTYGIIKDHKGDIIVHSKKDYGATFEIILPMKKEQMRKD